MKRILLTVALSVTALQAHANVIVFQQDISLPASRYLNGERDYNLPFFDTSLGVLTSASLQVSGFFSPRANVTSLGSGQVPTSVILKPRLTIFPVLDPVSGSIAFPPQTRSVVPTSANSGTVPGATPFSFSSTTPYPIRYATYPFAYVQLSAQTLVDLNGNGSLDVGVTGDNDFTTISGQISLSYTYTPVPEPLSLSLLCVGLAGLHLQRRRTGQGGALGATL